MPLIGELSVRPHRLTVIHFAPGENGGWSDEYGLSFLCRDQVKDWPDPDWKCRAEVLDVNRDSLVDGGTYAVLREGLLDETGHY